MCGSFSRLDFKMSLSYCVAGGGQHFPENSLCCLMTIELKMLEWVVWIFFLS